MLATIHAYRSRAGPWIGAYHRGMTLLGNLLWLVLAGWWVALAYVAAGIVNFVTIIGIPFGIQAFKLAGYALWPFGRVVVTTDAGYGPLALIGNVIWLILTGWELALAHLVAGLLLCLTIVGIPLGIASFKMVWLALVPFGKEVVPASAVHGDAAVFHGGVQPRTSPRAAA
jgi:uncharacterized membrane protein YccF (DUF307 family)